jgi:thiopeptide-type bacteriocin biosynthesis protein
LNEWIQLNVGLGRPSGAASARANASILFEALAGPLATWRGKGLVTGFFFQRKPPDVRLRFASAAARDHVARELEAVFDPLRERGVVTSCWTSVYEPEHRKFGGQSAMAAVHRWFDADTSIWMELELASGRDGATPVTPPSVICTAAANDLFARALGDPAEVWDTWCNYRALLPEPAPVPSPPEAIHGLDVLVAKLPAPQGTIVARYANADQDFADALDAISEAGELAVGRRAMLPFVAQHSFQRWGLDGPAQAAVVAGMCCAWDPHRRLRGA